MSEQHQPLKPGARFVKYEIIGLLGMGGHAHVYDAHDPFLDRAVALKVIRAPKGARHNLAKRAQSEARVLVRIDHPNVVKVFDAGATEDGLVYLVMEKLEGRTLREVYQDLGRLSVVEALDLATQICAGVHAAHQMDVIHRDLKPENVFVQANNRIKVLDFGISKVMGYGAHDTTQRHMLHGTVLYMSPEHLQGFGVTRKSDVFSLGTLLYEGLHAHPVLLSPHAQAENVRDLRDMRQVIYSQLSELPPMLHEVDPGIFRHVARFVQRAILKASEQRYETMAAMLEAARQSSERIEREEGAEFTARARRDLSRPQKLRREPEQRGDTAQVAMRFSTELEPVRYVTQPGGLTPPLPLGVTTPLDQHASGLPFQTTTPVPVSPGSVQPPSSRPASARPVVVVPPVHGPAVIAQGVTEQAASRRDSEALPTESLSHTPAQSATLALAEQVTRTASVDAKQLSLNDSDKTLGSSEHLGRDRRPSVVPVSRSSQRASDASATDTRSGVTAPTLRRRLSARFVLATGAALGLVLGIGFSIASMRAAVPEAASIQPAATAAADRPDPGGRALPPSGSPDPVPTLPSVHGEAAQELAVSDVGAGPSVPSRAGARRTPGENPRRTAAPAHPAAPTMERAPSEPAPVAPSAKASEPRASASAAVRKEQPGTWLKPDMIHFPDESTPRPRRPEQDRMPSSGLD